MRPAPAVLRASAIACSSAGARGLVANPGLVVVDLRPLGLGEPYPEASSSRRRASRQGAMTGHVAQMARMRSTEAAWSSRSRLDARWPSGHEPHPGSVPMHRAESRQSLMRHRPLDLRVNGDDAAADPLEYRNGHRVAEQLVARAVGLSLGPLVRRAPGRPHPVESGGEPRCRRQRARLRLAAARPWSG